MLVGSSNTLSLDKCALCALKKTKARSRYFVKTYTFFCFRFPFFSNFILFPSGPDNEKSCIVRCWFLFCLLLHFIFILMMPRRGFVENAGMEQCNNWASTAHTYTHTNTDGNKSGCCTTSSQNWTFTSAGVHMSSNV
jgi:hypothetical protein